MAHRQFGATRGELEQLRVWLRQEAVTHVVMESTRCYGSWNSMRPKIPPLAIRQLGDLTRRRKKPLANGTSERNRRQKVLEEANVNAGQSAFRRVGTSGQLMLDDLLKDTVMPLR